MTATTLTAMQTNFINDIADGSPVRDRLIQQLQSGFMFADVVECLNGQFSTGSFCDENNNQYPALYFSFEEAQKEHAESRESFELDHDDDDDAYEGVLFAVKWRTDDTLEFYAIDDIGVIDASSPVGVSSCNDSMGL